MRTSIPRCGGAMAAVATAAVVAACGSGGSSSTAGSRSATAPASTTADTTATSSASTSDSSSSGRAARARTASVPAGCTPAHTAVSVGQVGAATGHVGLTLLFRNSGAVPCTLTGYPGAALLAGAHRRLDIARTPQGYMGGLSPQARANPVVVLAPARLASAILEGEDFNPQTSAACPRYSKLLVTPPNQRVTVRLARSLAICDPEIHPVVAGTSGRQRL